MNHLFKRILFLFFIPLFVTGCSSKQETVICPFTHFTWENTLEEITSGEGTLLESYPSSFNGTTYVYKKEYDGMEGTVKYMFNEENKLMSMAWLYLPSSDEELEEVYSDLVSRTAKLYGDSGFQSDLVTAKGEVWYLSEGNILIGVMSTGVNEAVQYQFFHPEVSSGQPANNSDNLKSIAEKLFSGEK